MESALNDDSLVLALKGGSEQAFSTMFNIHHKRLYYFSFRILKSKALAEDIVQETFIRLWNAKERLDETNNFESYLYRIAKNLIIDYLRKITNEKLYLSEAAHRQDVSRSTTDEIINYNELEQLTNELVDLMPGQQKIVYKLSRENGLSRNEISKKLGISGNTVKVHIYNSLKFLKEKMAR